jgi:hypothetical protein
MSVLITTLLIIALFVLLGMGVWIGLALAGVAWIAMMAGLNGSAQTAVPAWVRARALGIYLLVFQGGLGIGLAMRRRSALSS